MSCDELFDRMRLCAIVIVKNIIIITSMTINNTHTHTQLAIYITCLGNLTSSSSGSDVRNAFVVDAMDDVTTDRKTFMFRLGSRFVVIRFDDDELHENATIV
jgi:hypothetical protein